MIKANELRIGNLVQATLSGKVYEIDLWALGVINDGNYQNSYFPKVAVFEPIRLTEEWLLKFGFKHFTELWYEKVFLSISIKHGVILNDDYNSTINLPCEIQYVHQLQNLYFALTGEELTIKTENK